MHQQVRSDKLRSTNWDLHYFALSNTTIKHFEVLTDVWGFGVVVCVWVFFFFLVG
jgi:hypothetical protein